MWLMGGSENVQVMLMEKCSSEGEMRLLGLELDSVAPAIPPE